MLSKKSNVKSQLIEILTGEAISNNTIAPDQFKKHGIKRGLRNEDGTGVKTILTEISDVRGYKIDKGKVPIEGQLIYRGIEAGTVTKMTFNKDMVNSVTAHIQLHSQAEFILHENTKFWVVEPQVSINRVANLDTLFKGAYISFLPGDGEYSDQFELQEQPNTTEILRPGKHFKLTTDNSESLSLGAPVLYKKMQVGEVTGFGLVREIGESA